MFAGGEDRDKREAGQEYNSKEVTEDSSKDAPGNVDKKPLARRHNEERGKTWSRSCEVYLECGRIEEGVS